MKIIISGASGLVGSALLPALRGDGHHVIQLVRHSTTIETDIFPWQPADGKLEASVLEGADALINLSGEILVSGRWTERKKKRLYDSRIDTASLLAKTVASLKHPPSVVLSASAIGYYGSRGNEQLTENSASGDSFIARLCRDWEAAWQPTIESNIRTVSLRIGVVLTPNGGALSKMLPPFRLGMGGRLGDGRQYFSWISMADLIDIFRFALVTSTLNGPVNAVAPHSMTNAEFTKTLARVLRRPAIFPVPATMLRLGLGQMADEILLSSTRVVPEKLVNAGFTFTHPVLENGLRMLLGKI